MSNRIHGNGFPPPPIPAGGVPIIGQQVEVNLTPLLNLVGAELDPDVVAVGAALPPQVMLGVLPLLLAVQQCRLLKGTAGRVT